MARRGAASDLVTIVYPPGCREISEEIGNDELIRRLKTLAHTFQALSQAEDESTYSDYTPLAIHLAEEHFLSHASRDVQLLVACCIADILRIFAPEAPYKDPAQIKVIFYFLIKQLGGLKDPKDPAFKRYFYLLENMAYVKSFNMCFDLEECSEIFCALFQLMFNIVNDEHSGKVKSFMLDVLSPLITEADFVSNELLDIILINIVDPFKSQRKNAYSLAKDLVVKTNMTLEPYIQQFFNQVLILGKADTRLSIARKVYELIYELNHICPRILLTVLPQLEFKLKSTEETERMGSVSLLARMFSEPGHSLARNHRQLWLAFLGRYNDISVAIRTKCVQYTMHFLLNHPELIDDITETLKLRQHDTEENVRYEVVMAIVSTAKKDFDVVSQSEELLNFVKERTLDKKFKIRKEAMSGLAMIYKKQLTTQYVPQATKHAVTWIKDKILHGYYMSGMEDRLLVERLVNTCLVPFSLDSSERMKKLLLLFATIDDNASKAFIEVQKHQLMVRKCVAELVELHKKDSEEIKPKEISSKLIAVSKHLPTPIKAMEFLKRLSAHLLQDKYMLDLFEKVVDPEISCADCMQAVNQILKKLGPPVMTNLYYNTVKQLLERISSVMVDSEAIAHLVAFVKEALSGGAIVEELGLDPTQAEERGLRLLMVLAFVFPSHFLFKDVIRELISLLTVKGNPNIAPLTLSVLSYIGKQRPLGDALPDSLSVLVPICKQFIAKGSPKEAKQAVKCLFIDTTDTQEAVFTEILETVKGNLDPEKGDSYLSAIVSLGHIAFHMPDKAPIHIKNLVSRKIVKELLMQDRTEARQDDDEDWCDFDDLPLETRCKLEGMKMMSRWLIGLKDDKEEDRGNGVTISAQKTFRMLNAVIDTKGDLLEEGKPSPSERSWFRLSAGCAILKICEQKGVGDKYTLDQFYTLASLVRDPVMQVRERILIRLHKGLARGIPYKCLPLDFMGLYVLAGFETEKRVRAMARQYMILDINKRKDYVKNILMNNTGDRMGHQLNRILPDYMLCYAVPILTHVVSEYETYDDIEMLKKLQGALWFVMEPLMMKNENFSFSFYKAMVEKMKQHKDKRKPEDETTNYRLWACCDLAMSVLISKTTNYELKEFPAELTMSGLFYEPHEDPGFNNQNNYLPPELIPKAPKKASMFMPMVALPPANKVDFTTTTTVIVTGDEGDSQSVTLDMGEGTSTNGSNGDSKPAARKRGRPAAASSSTAASVSTEESPVVESKRVRSTRGGAAAVEEEEEVVPEVETKMEMADDEEGSGRPRRSTRK